MPGSGHYDYYNYNDVLNSPAPTSGVVYLPQLNNSPRAADQDHPIQHPQSHRQSWNKTQKILIGICIILIAFAIVTIDVLGLLHATWVGGSLLQIAGWSGGIGANQLGKLSCYSIGMLLCFNSIYSLYEYRFDPQSFLGLTGKKATTAKILLFCSTAALLSPLILGITSGATYGFSLVAMSIGLPLVMMGILIASYLAVVNLAAIFLAAVLAADDDFSPAVTSAQQSAAELNCTGFNRADMIADAMADARNMIAAGQEPDIVIVPDRVSSQPTGTPALVQYPEVTHTEEETRPLTIQELRAARLRYFT